MRIEGWHVDGFGVWHDADVSDLGRGVTVFLGENEAGKTTLLAFLRAMLFGFADRRTRDNPYPPLAGGRHGGQLRLRDENGVWAVARYADQRRVVEVTRPDGRAGDDSDLRRLLSGVDAALFTSVFAFSLAELQQFATLDAESVRERIFSVGISGAGQSARAVLKGFTDQESRLLKQRAGQARINQLVVRLKEAEEHLRQAEKDASRYPELRRAEDEGTARITDLDEELAEIATVRRRYESFITLRREADASADAQAALADLPSPSDPALPDVVADLVARLRILADKEQALPNLRAEQLAAADDREQLMGHLGAGWTTERLLTTDDSVAVRDAVRDWQRKLQNTAVVVDRCEGEERAARETLAEIAVDDDRCRAELPKDQPPTLEELTAHDIAVRSLRSHLRELETAELQAGSQSSRSRRLGRLLALGALLLVAAAVVAAVAGAPQLGIGLAVGAAILTVAAVLTFVTSDDRGSDAGASEVALSDLRDDVARSARTLGFGDRPTEADVDAREAQLAHDRSRRASCDTTGAQLRQIEAKRAAQEAKVARVAGEAEAARQEAARAASVWHNWLAARDLPAVSPDGALELFDTVRRARSAHQQETKAGEALAALASERAQWSRQTAEALASAGLAQGETAPSTLESALTNLDEALARRAELVAQRDGCEQRLETGLAQFDDPQSARRELTDGDPDSWGREIAALDVQRRETDTERTSAIEARRDARRAREALEASADVPRCQDELEALRAELARAVHEYRVVTAAEGLVRETLRSYVRDRQPGVLARASAAFGAVTGGRFSAVVQEAAEDSDAIVVERPDGSTLSPDKLSRGTCEQLYLVIRLALATDFAARGQALPLIMDDCLVNFDPVRAAAMARLIADLSADGQCLFFTCHPSTADQLIEAAPGAKLVRLPGQAAASAAGHAGGLPTP